MVEADLDVQRAQEVAVLEEMRVLGRCVSLERPFKSEGVV